MTTEMSAGVRIILERIENYPQDFAPDMLQTSSSWASLASIVVREKDTFSEEERKAVRDALRNGRRREFDARIMDKLNEQPRVKTVGGGAMTKAQMTQAIEKSLAEQFNLVYRPRKEGGRV